MTPEALADLHARCFTMPRPWSRDEFADLLASPHVFLVSRPQGFALGRVIAGEAELLTIAVAPQARRTGLGHALMRDFEAKARTLAAQEVFLEVAETNTPARALYRAQGYAEAGYRKSYYQAPNGARIDALILRKTLT